MKWLRKMLEIQLEINSWDMLVMGAISLSFYLLAIALPVDSALVSESFSPDRGVLFFKFVLFGVSILLAWLSVSAYTRMHSERLLIYVLFASGSIAFMLLFAFQRIIDNAGLYFLSAWTPVIAYFIVAGLIALWLNNYWNSGIIGRYKNSGFLFDRMLWLLDEFSMKIATMIYPEIEQQNFERGNERTSRPNALSFILPKDREYEFQKVTFGE